MSILELFCSVDDFWQQFAPSWHHDMLTSGQRQRLRPTQMYQSSIMTIIILFHHSHYRTFKAYYPEYVQRHWCGEFPTLVSYQRFASVDAHRAGSTGAPICTRNWAIVTSISFIDSTRCLPPCTHPPASRV